MANITLILHKVRLKSLRMATSLPLHSRIKASLRKPREVTSYSIDINNQVKIDDSSLRYYYLPEAQIDGNLELSQGYKDFIRKDESKAQHLDTLLTAVIEYEKESNSKIKADIISWRGIMTKLLCLPYEQGDDIDLNVLLFDGQIFLEEDFDLTKNKKRKMDAKGEMMSYWGK